MLTLPLALSWRLCRLSPPLRRQLAFRIGRVSPVQWHDRAPPSPPWPFRSTPPLSSGHTSSIPAVSHHLPSVRKALRRSHLQRLRPERRVLVRTVLNSWRSHFP